jgi:hypothetical protein
MGSIWETYLGMTGDLAARRSGVHEEGSTEPVSVRSILSCSLVLAFSSYYDSFALSVPCQIIDLTT